jgi:pentose-5-phosphate-3-epimerase
MLLKAGISPGVAINPGTKFPSWIIEHLDNIDVMIIMSVNPGFAGQKFIPEALDKMAEVVKTLKSNNYKGFIEADGGIDATTLQQVFDAGARIMVAGNAVYGSADINSNIIQLRHKANVAIETKLLELATINDMRSDWINSRKNMLIPLAKELSIEEDLHAIK